MSDHGHYVKIGNVRIQVRMNNMEREFRLTPEDHWRPLHKFVDHLIEYSEWKVLSELAIHGIKQTEL